MDLSVAGQRRQVVGRTGLISGTFMACIGDAEETRCRCRRPPISGATIPIQSNPIQSDG